ncbi:DNA polymerase I [Impatiens glandulifera]|uniref:DNA polymerase I n=1 Tax=Impatiens glandulifera TaxID=253017 RepID=UPI001FB0D452|nr:DNA polymerase I [Impatiens glandulifera]
MLKAIIVFPNPFIGNPDIKITLPSSSSSQVKHLRRNIPLKIQSCSISFQTLNRTVGGIEFPTNNSSHERRLTETPYTYNKKTKRVFFLDVNPLCYDGNNPSLHNFAHWISLFFSQVSHSDPVIAVIDGDGGSEYRRQLLPSYKANRRIFSKQHLPWRRVSKDYGSWSDFVVDLLKKLNVTVIKLNGYEADDVIATLVDDVLDKGGYKVVIASPDKDFKQLISENVQIVLPMPRFDRWSFYTLKHYITQYNCHPSSDLSLRCLVGDEVDGVPGIQHVVPGFGLKTALKLLKKHGSLEDLLKTAAVRSVGKQYVQDALTNHADYLRRNYQVLALRRDVDVSLEDEWLLERNTCNDTMLISKFLEILDQKHLS